MKGMNGVSLLHALVPEKLHVTFPSGIKFWPSTKLRTMAMSLLSIVREMPSTVATN